jgi:hypothetical protein
VLLEAILRTGGEHTILVPFDDLGLHGQVLRDTMAADWLILLDARHPDSLHALDRADFDASKSFRASNFPTLTPARSSVCSEFGSRLPRALRSGPASVHGRVKSLQSMAADPDKSGPARPLSVPVSAGPVLTLVVADGERKSIVVEHGGDLETTA